MAAEPATSASAPETPQPTIWLPVHRFDVDDYYKIAETGILDDLRVELLEGLIIDMSPPSPGHSLTIERLTDHFRAVPLRLRVQLPFEIRPDNVPQPDLLLTAEPASPRHHPSTALLAVEVSVSSHMIDRNVKAGYYARADIPTYWIVDVPHGRVEVRTEPGSNSYRKCDIYHEGHTVPSPAPGVDELDVNTLFAG